jgi:hypothetical protein
MRLSDKDKMGYLSICGLSEKGLDMMDQDYVSVLMFDQRNRSSNTPPLPGF